MSRTKKYIFIGLGIIATSIGMVGIFVPVLPTTPFLLLAAFLFSKSSERFLYWLCHNRLCGKYIDNYRKGLGLPLMQKIMTIALLWLTIGLSAFVFIDTLWVKIMLIGIAIAVTTHLILMKTYKPEDVEDQSEKVKAEDLEIQPHFETK